MKQIIKLTLVMLVTFFINGCLEDQTDYIGSTYSKINIANLVDISDSGYLLDGSGKVNHESAGWYLLFCKGNRYKYGASALTKPKIYEGSYKVDLDKNEIIMIGDDLDSAGKHIKGTFKTNNGQFKQKERYINQGLGLEFNSLEQINSSDDCVLKRANHPNG